MTAHGCVYGGSALETVTGLDLGVVLDEQLNNFLVAELAGVHEWRDLAHGVGEGILDVAAVLDEHFDTVSIVATDCQMDGQLAALVWFVEAANAVLVVHDDLRGDGRVVLLFGARVAQKHLDVDAATSQTGVVQWDAAARV